MRERDGASLIFEERVRQVMDEGYGARHDDEHRVGEIIAAAECYARVAEIQVRTGAKVPPCFLPKTWPWEKEAWKPSLDPVENLVKAGALLAAEVDRIHRQREERGGLARGR